MFLFSAKAFNGYACLQNKDVLLRVAFQVLCSLVIFPTLFPNMVHPMISSNSYSYLLYIYAWSLWLTPVPLHWKNLTFSEYRLSPALDGQDGVSSPPRWLPAWVPCLPQFTGSQVFLDPYSKLPAVLDSMPHLAYMRLCPCPIWELLKGKVCVLFIFKTLYHLASWEVQNK